MKKQPKQVSPSEFDEERYGMILPNNSYYILSRCLTKLNVLELRMNGQTSQKTNEGVSIPKYGIRTLDTIQHKVWVVWKNSGEIRTLSAWQEPIQNMGVPDAKIRQLDFSMKMNDGEVHRMSFRRDTIHVKYFEDMLKRADKPAPFKKLLEKLYQFRLEVTRDKRIPENILKSLAPSPMFSLNLNPKLSLNLEKLAYIRNYYIPIGIIIREASGKFGLTYFEPTTEDDFTI